MRQSGQDLLIADIEAEVRITRDFTGKEALDPRVMEAMRTVPRDAFVGSGVRRFAFDNGPLPIGCGQTISQPYIVALMTDLLQVEEDADVLEVGTGSGYQAAVLSRLVRQVYSVEIIDTLAAQARAHLQDLGYGNVAIRTADGYQGWPEHSPYDGIIVTAAAREVPRPLVEQLKPGGRLVIPVGGTHSTQQLQVLHKDADGETYKRDVLAVRFVPFTGEGAE